MPPLGDRRRTDILTVENPSYEGLTHRRTVWFVDRRFFVIEDVATGVAAGRVALHYNLAECQPRRGVAAGRVATRFEDGTTSCCRSSGKRQSPRRGGSRTSTVRATPSGLRLHGGEAARQGGTFITVLLPTEHPAEAKIKAERRRGTIRVTVDGRKYDLK